MFIAKTHRQSDSVPVTNVIHLPPSPSYLPDLHLHAITNSENMSLQLQRKRLPQWVPKLYIYTLLLLLSALQSTLGSTPASVGGGSKHQIVIGIDGGTESIRACCFNAHTGHIVGKAHAVPYKTSHPNAGWAEQNPEDWYDNLCEAVRGALSSLTTSDGSVDDVTALCCDTTCCSVVALSSSPHKPLRPCLLWMDARSAKQASQIMSIANSHASKLGIPVLEAFPELRVNSNGEGPISAEWLLPKAMWIKQNERKVWDEAEVICEYQDCK